MWRDDINSREHYLWFADNYYLGARNLILSGQSIAAGPIAALAVEQYLKLKAFELLKDEDNTLLPTKTKNKFIKEIHNLEILFKAIEEPMRLNHLTIQSFEHYQPILNKLTKAWENKYFDDFGLKGEIEKNGSVQVGISVSALADFDELCCELRNAVYIGSYELIDQLLVGSSDSQAQLWSLKENNLQYENFKDRRFLYNP